MWLDLGGIAKGYMGDEAVKAMTEKGCPICACYAGGDRVFVPVDDKQKPVGGKVYVPEAFYQELYRHAAPTETL